ncbi:MAG: ABC transporter substrate-binding protein [Betaproteobacteria bacterium]|nr:MAG: ABC transporter substrate-binding protein [Betaproteobacteria bacterium]
MTRRNPSMIRTRSVVSWRAATRFASSISESGISTVVFIWVYVSCKLAGRQLRGRGPGQRQARQPSPRAADQVWADHQSQDGENNRADGVAVASAAARRGDSMTMRRRDVLAFLGGAAIAFPLGTRAQSVAMPVVGFLNSTSPDIYAFNAAAFREGLRQAGYVEGQDVVIEYRWANSDYTRLTALALDLVRRKVNVIAATGDVASARAAQAATKAIPIVFTVGSDPVRFGLVQSLSHPGGNATGITLFSSTLTSKRMELLRDVAPNATTIALLTNPENQNVEVDVNAAQEAAQALGRKVIVVRARGVSEFDAAFEMIEQRRIGAVLVASDPMFLGQRNNLVALAASHKIPVMYRAREFATAGGLISYGTSITWMYREAGIYTGRILKGAKPANLPILQPTKFDFVVNLRTAKALGIVIPQSLLLRADEVIQ